jgi:hypothetical protein
MAIHTEDSLRRARIPQILNLLLAVPAFEAVGAEGLVASQDGQILNLVPTAAAAICAVVADQGAIAEEKKVRIGVEQGAASITPKAVDMPSVAS